MWAVLTGPGGAVIQIRAARAAGQTVSRCVFRNPRIQEAPAGGLGGTDGRRSPAERGAPQVFPLVRLLTGFSVEGSGAAVPVRTPVRQCLSAS